jgi:hypothetical protein
MLTRSKTSEWVGGCDWSKIDQTKKREGVDVAAPTRTCAVLHPAQVAVVGRRQRREGAEQRLLGGWPL